MASPCVLQGMRKQRLVYEGQGPQLQLARRGGMRGDHLQSGHAVLEGGGQVAELHRDAAASAEAWHWRASLWAAAHTQRGHRTVVPGTADQGEPAAHLLLHMVVFCYSFCRCFLCRCLCSVCKQGSMLLLSFLPARMKFLRCSYRSSFF